jgi:hypothetical protein
VDAGRNNRTRETQIYPQQQQKQGERLKSSVLHILTSTP